MSELSITPYLRKRKVGRNSVLEVTKPKRPKSNNTFHVRSHIKLISDIEDNVSASRLHYNRIAELIQHAKTQEEVELSKAATLALCRIFSKFLAAGILSTHRHPTSEDAIISKWLHGRYYEFVDFLFDRIATASPEGQSLALNTLMHLAREDSVCSDVNLVDKKTIMFRLLELLTIGESYHNIRLEFIRKFVNLYDDIKVYTFDAIAYESTLLSIDFDLRLSRKITLPMVKEDQMNAVIAILVPISAISNFENRSPSLYFRPSISKYSNLYWTKIQTKHAKIAWVNVFRHSLSKAQRKLLLSLLVPKISRCIPQIELLIDFLTDSFNTEGSTSLLALSGLFHLMQEKNLDYPQFFEKMYSMLDHMVLHSKHRSRFFRLLIKCLESTHLPATLIASFIKRLSQIALHSSPSGTIIVIPLIYNLLNNHPSSTFMIHRDKLDTGRGHENEEGALDEPFHADATDPMETRAEQSSIWEIKSLQFHYHPSVAMVARIISGPFFKSMYSTEDFLDHSYNTVWLSSPRQSCEATNLIDTVD